MPTAEYMREYRKRAGVRERELRNKREYDLFHQAENRARWNRRDRVIWNAYAERFGEIYGGITRLDFRLMAKSLKDGIDYLADRRAQDAASQEQYERERAANDAKIDDAIRREAERQAKTDGPFSAKTERTYTRLIKNRKLFEGACELRWPEYFEFRQANECARLTANDLRYAGQYTVCPAPKR